MKHWVRFEGKPYGRDRSRPRVSIGPSKALMLNPAAYGMLGTPDTVEMYYDELRKTIGLKRSHESREYAFPVRQKKNSKYMVVYVGAFCNHFKIEITNSVEFKRGAENVKRKMENGKLKAKSGKRKADCDL